MSYKELAQDKQFEAILSKAGNDSDYGRSVYWQIFACWKLGKIDQALQIIKNTTKEEIEPDWEVKYYMMKGVCLYLSGELVNALNSYEHVLEIITLDHDIGLHQVLNNMAVIYRDRGQYEQAVEKLQASLITSKRHGDKKNMVMALLNIATVLKLQGNFTEAQQRLLKCLDILYDEIDEPSIKIYALKELLENYIILEQDSEVEEVYSKIERLVDNSENTEIDGIAKFAKALYLKNSTRMIYKTKAQQTFMEIVETADFDYNIKLDSYLHLIDLLIDEFELYQSQEVFEDVKGYTRRLLDLCSDQNLHTRNIDILILQSKLAMVQYQYKNALEHLNTARQLAQRYGLSEKLTQVQIERREFKDKMLQLKEIVTEPDFSKMIEKTQLKEYIKFARHHAKHYRD